MLSRVLEGMFCLVLIPLKIAESLGLELVNHVTGLCLNGRHDLDDKDRCKRCGHVEIIY